MKTRGANFRLLVTGGLFASLFLALALAVAPQSHERAHHDAATGHHECAVTLIATGKYQQNEAPVLVSLPQPSVQWGKIPSFHPVWVAAPFLGACIFEHAPPALS
ncbi:MAG TPA: hypothetical protein VGW39_00240 [Chthoniobacterales bacterium]|nr:hypothetical protein [Chthoniobacterales bacterium]